MRRHLFVLTYIYKYILFNAARVVQDWSGATVAAGEGAVEEVGEG